ncbi:MAG: putative DNA-binding transcriptional regulator YafY [Cyclobacteriaceae bacterium]|jgi:predicted DNA-binding transcriptional regulator YafY
MNFIHQIERLQRLNQLIKAANTGTPDEFAIQMHISRRQLYNYIEELKNMGLAIKYCKRQKTFYYADDCELALDFSFRVLRPEQKFQISGGMSRFFIACNDIARCV